MYYPLVLKLTIHDFDRTLSILYFPFVSRSYSVNKKTVNHFEFAQPTFCEFSKYLAFVFISRNHEFATVTGLKFDWKPFGFQYLTGFSTTFSPICIHGHTRQDNKTLKQLLWTWWTRCISGWEDSRTVTEAHHSKLGNEYRIYS